jgi:hypothetical protein
VNKRMRENEDRYVIEKREFVKKMEEMDIVY